MGLPYLRILLLTVITLTTGNAIVPPPARAQMISGVCSFYSSNGTKLSWRKQCTLDAFNSGNISFITNNGTMWFMLNDSMNKTYKYAGKIWHADDRYCGDSCTFKSGGDSLTYTSAR